MAAFINFQNVFSVDLTYYFRLILTLIVVLAFIEFTLRVGFALVDITYYLSFSDRLEHLISLLAVHITDFGPQAVASGIYRNQSISHTHDFLRSLLSASQTKTFSFVLNLVAKLKASTCEFINLL